jgi:hypothetical protein
VDGREFPNTKEVAGEGGGYREKGRGGENLMPTSAEVRRSTEKSTFFV